MFILQNTMKSSLPSPHEYGVPNEICEVWYQMRFVRCGTLNEICEVWYQMRFVRCGRKWDLWGVVPNEIFQVWYQIKWNLWGVVQHWYVRYKLRFVKNKNESFGKRNVICEWQNKMCSLSKVTVLTVQYKWH